MKLQPALKGLDGAHVFLAEVLDAIAERGRTLLSRRDRAGVSAKAQPSLSNLGRLLLSRKGEASGTVIAATLASRFAAAGQGERLAFLQALADEFGPDVEKVDEAIAAFRSEPSAHNLRLLHAAAEPRRQELFRRINLGPSGTRVLVSMREEMLAALKDNPALAAVDADFTHLFASWFNRGFLMLRRIDWSMPASILSKIIQYEAVHAIRDWDDLRNRLEPADRRCYGFFHPQLVDEPLIFVEVALTRSTPRAVAPLLDTAREPLHPEDADTAVFYSISNTQRGLAGVSFGNFLIKQVVEELKNDVPGLKTFVTLSPVPGFASWLARERTERGGDEALAALDSPEWWTRPEVAASVSTALEPWAARYFLHAKGAGGRPLDPVARFHLGNGAILDQLNPLGDLSGKGLRQSHGLMVNYRYDPGSIEINHEAFAEKGTVAAAPAIVRLAEGSAGPGKPRPPETKAASVP